MKTVLYHIQKKILENPHAIAAIHRESTFTYEALEASSNRLCHYLTAHQVKKGDKVVFLMKRSFDMLATILAIWKLGAAYVPLDPKMPSARIQHVLTQLEPRCVVTEPALLGKFSQSEWPLLTLSDPVFQDCSPIFTTQEFQNLEEELAYIIYTSGSTGEPKGVMLTHANLMNHVEWLVQKFRFSSIDCFSFNSSMAFDFSVACTLLPLSVGAKILITSEEDTLDIKQYCYELVKNQVTFAKWTPSYFKLIVDYVEKYHVDLSAFKFIMLGGEELLTSYVERWFNIYPSHSLINEYGPTEASVGITTHVVTQSTLDKTLHAVPIGEPAIHTQLYIVNSQCALVQEGEVGELLIGGASVARGYYKQSHLTAQSFIDSPFSSDHQKLYKTGDLVKRLPDGNYFYMGRIDRQIKIDGYRVELSEVEHRILQYIAVKQAVVVPEKGEKNLPLLTCYVVFHENQSVNFEPLQKYLMQFLSEFMIPKRYYRVNHVPLNKNGKIDYVALKKNILTVETGKESPVFFSNPFIDFIIRIVKKHVTIDNVDIHAPLFLMGVTSLLAVQIVDAINEKCGEILKIQDLFHYSTIASLANFLDAQQHKNAVASVSRSKHQERRSQQEPIAIIAMDCRLPGAEHCEALWNLCRDGGEGITFFNDKKNEKYRSALSDVYPVYARGILQNIEYFDAEFFNFNPKEAHFSDPQHRLLLESAWIAFEKAGYVPGSEDAKSVGVFVSMNDSTYLVDHDVMKLGKDYFNDRFALLRLMSSQFLATKISYHLNCTGPSFTIQAACSSSLVAVALACQQLSDYHCDMALAGGISVVTPQDSPYFYQRGNIFSPDGHCRPFDADAAGTVFSNGLGLVVLKRLSDALRDNDSIMSVIRGVNINNDGHQKISYSAPSLEGQEACILSAQADIDVNTIQYMEAHGTGTLIGDPIEIEALTNAFRAKTAREQYCALGSLKANIGHAHVAAGVASLIKTTLALQHRQIPPTIHYEQPNPNIDFDRSPFYVNTRLQYWPRHQYPRRAAISALGVGGTNVHLILEEAPKQASSPIKRPYYLLLLSAKTKAALREYHDRLIHFLEDVDIQKDQSILLADMAYTLQQGRNKFAYRSGIVCNNIADAIQQLKKEMDKEVIPVSDSPHWIFLFPGQGTQYPNLSLSLYHEEPIYKKYLDYCLDTASLYIQADLKSILFSNQENIDFSESKLYQTEFTHPILFSVEYALAKLLMHWGIKPTAMLGHSLGEYVAACLSGVFSLEDAIKLVCARGSAIARCERGAMLSAPLSEEVALSFCNDEISIAAVNAEDSCVFSGSEAAIQTLQDTLRSLQPNNDSLLFRRLKCQYPFHSNLLNPAIDSFRVVLQSIKRNAPVIPYLSNVTGDWITEFHVKHDDYWIEHLLKTVQFSRCVRHLTIHSNMVFLELGPGQTLLSFVQKHKNSKIQSIELLPSASAYQKEQNSFSVGHALKALWCYGYSIDWKKYYGNERRYRIPLPTYPFQRKRYWFDEIVKDRPEAGDSISQKSDTLFYTPTWVRDPEPMRHTDQQSFESKKCKWIIFDDDSALSQQIILHLESNHAMFVVIRKGDNFYCNDKNYFILNPKEKSHYDQVIEQVTEKNIEHYVIIHFWSTGRTEFQVQKNLLDSHILYQGFYSGLFIAQAFYRVNPDAMIACALITEELHAVLGNEKATPLKSSVLSLCRVLPLENKNFRISNIDLASSVDFKDFSLYADNIMSNILANLYSEDPKNSDIVAYRNRYCWRVMYSDIKVAERTQKPKFMMHANAVYFITGGLGGMGLVIADWLSQKAPVTLLLISRTPFPSQEKWEIWIKTHDSDDAVTQKIKKLKEIIHRGSSVLIESADIADYRQMQPIILKTEQSYGAIQGIFHLAGVPGEGISVLKNEHNIREVLSPKLQGTWVLARLFRRKKLDFIVCASSLTAIAGGVGQLDYCAANLFIDYFMAQHPFKQCKQVLTINWNSWTEVGMAANVKHSKIHEKLYQGNSVAPNEAVVILETLLNVDYAQVIISRLSPEDEIKRIINAFKTVIEKDKNNLHRQTTANQSYQNIFDAIKLIWKEILGVDVIQKDDTFYSLGGDSLLAIQLQIALERQFNVDILLQDLAYNHTIESLAQFIECQPVRSDRTIISLSDTENLSSEKSKTLVYFIHPLGGTVLCYFSLKSYLKTTLSCYAIQDPEITKAKIIFQSIEDMALYYVNEMIKNQKIEDVILVGFSFGGNVAVEMAALLEKRGITVRKIILIDSWANFGSIEDDNDQRKPLESLEIIRKYYGVNSHQYQTIQKRLTWLRHYIPTMVNVPIVLLNAEDLLPIYKKIATEDHGWGQYCSHPVEQYTVPGNHDTLFQSHHLSNLSVILDGLLYNY